MSSSHRHPLYVEMRPDYEPRLGAILRNLAAYRSTEEIDWRAGVEAWLSNFDGLRDQRLAMGMLERVRVVSEAEIVEGCKSLLATIQATLPANARIFHFAHETSGALLIRVLEKDVRIRGFTVLRQADFAKLDKIGKLRDGDAVVVWDRFNGTGEQLTKIVKKYGATFAASTKTIDSLHMAYIAGHPLQEPLPPGAVLHRWIEDVPSASSEELELCDRYADAAGATATNRNHETGALLTFADNPPNNVPLVLQEPASDGWFSLLDRKSTVTP
jgi:hypothetical protein